MSSLKFKNGLFVGIMVLALGLISLWVINKYNTGFLGGFITGLLLAFGIGLVVINKK